MHCLFVYIIHYKHYLNHIGGYNYGVGYIYIYIYFVYNSTASIPWIISVNNFRFFTNISEIMYSTKHVVISLERSFYSVFSSVCCIKIDVKITEILQVIVFHFSSSFHFHCSLYFGQPLSHSLIIHLFNS